MQQATHQQPDIADERDLLKIVTLINRAMFFTQDKDETAILHYYLHQARQEAIGMVDVEFNENLTSLN